MVLILTDCRRCGRAFRPPAGGNLLVPGGHLCGACRQRHADNAARLARHAMELLAEDQLHDAALFLDAAAEQARLGR